MPATPRGRAGATLAARRRKNGAGAGRRPTPHRVDLAEWLRLRQGDLRRRLERRDALVDMMHSVTVTLEPAVIAQSLVDRAAAWLPARCWAVIATDPRGQTAALASLRWDAAMGPAIYAIASWIASSGEAFMSADLRHDPRVPDARLGAVMGVPLTCRERTIGALIASTRSASARAPRLAPATARALGVMLEPAAAALDNALLLKHAEALSVTDDLTLAYNSRYLHQVLRRETKRAARTGRPLSLLFIDLDNFKSVNDAHGHLCGSRTLVEAATIMHDSARETDVVARYGGDEFAVVLPETGAEGAKAVGERIRSRIAAHQFLAGAGINMSLTASVGIATLPDVTGSADGLLQAADAAMYQVKARGKNGLQAAGAPDDTL